MDQVSEKATDSEIFGAASQEDDNFNRMVRRATALPLVPLNKVEEV